MSGLEQLEKDIKKLESNYNKAILMVKSGCLDKTLSKELFVSMLEDMKALSINSQVQKAFMMETKGMMEVIMKHVGGKE